MESLLVFVVSFVIIFVIYLVVYFIRRTSGTLYKSKDVELICAKFNLKKKNLDLNRLCLLTALVNSLIISITGTICTSVDLDYIWELAIGFVMLMGLIYIIYTLLGRYLKKKEGMKK